MSYPGHVENGIVVPDRPLPLPDGTPVRIEAIAPVPADFWQSCSLDELAKQQGVAAPAAFEDLLGGWPTDEVNDDFEDACRIWRERELEQDQ